MGEYYNLAEYPTQDTVNMLTWLLEKVLKTNDTIERECGEYKLFYAKAIPGIKIQSYLYRILNYCPCTNEVFLSLLIYFDRLARNETALRLNSFNIHRLIITGIMVANKFFSDKYYTNARFAKVGGLSIHELNSLEVEFLKLCNFRLFITLEELQKYGDQLLIHCENDNQYSIHYSNQIDKQQQYQTFSKDTNKTNVSDPRQDSITKC